MHIFKTYFETIDLILLFLGIGFSFLAIFYHEIKQNEKTSLFLILLGALILRIFAANLDNFYNLWDEQYHALVAKSMILNPFKPMLYSDPALPYWFPDWGNNHIWLHKQPMFLWQIALSFKIFGISPFTLRLPSIILSTLLVYLTYDIAKQLFNNKIAFYAAFLMCGQNIFLSLISGQIPTDHNDVAFIFYVTASIWAWIKYLDKRSWKWIIWIGVFAGFAVLNKWLTGLLVYFGWFWYLILSKDYLKKKEIFRYIISVFISIFIFLPWQIFISIKYPLESKWEYYYNSLHFTKVIEGHGGNIWFHFQSFTEIYGIFFSILIPIGLIILIFRFRSANKIILLCILLNICIVYLFFSIAKTKMLAFTIIVMPYMLILAALIIYNSLSFIYNKFSLKEIYRKFINFSLLIILLITIINIEKIQYFHTNWNIDVKNKRDQRIWPYQVSKQLDTMLNNQKYVIFNTPEFSDITVMIGSKQIAYDLIPSLSEINNLKNDKRNIAVFMNDSVPDYMLNDTSILKIKSIIWGDISNNNKPKTYR